MLCMIDLMIVFISFGLAYWVKIDFEIPSKASLNYEKALLSITAVLIVYTISFISFKIHKSLWKYIGPIESLRLGLSVTLSSFVLLLCVVFSGVERFYLGIVVTGGLIAGLIMFNCRLGYRLYRRYLSKSDSDNRKAIIIGAGDAGYILMKELSQNEAYGVDIVGFVDDKRMHKVIAGYKVLGDTYDLAQIVQKHEIKCAFIAIPSADKINIQRIFDLCQSLQLETKIMRTSDMLVSDDNNHGENHVPLREISIEDLLGRGEIHLNQTEINSYLCGHVVAVTGAGGSIGSELCRQIVKFKPKKLIMIDVNENTLYMLEQEFNRQRMHHYLDEKIVIISLIVSVRDYAAMLEVFEEHQPEVVFHAAAHKHVPLMETRPIEAIKNNVFGTQNVINACLKKKVSRFIIISTDKAVNPTNVMGASKRMTELLLQAYGNQSTTKMAAVRFGNVLGSNGSVIPIFKRQIEEGGPITITDKEIKRYFMTIPEAAQLVLQAGYYADKGEIFVLDMGSPVKILNLAEKMIRLNNLKPYEDIDIVEIGLRPGEKMFEELRLDNETTIKTKNNLIYKNYVMDIQVEEIQARLLLLSNAMANFEDNERIKALMLDVIKDDFKCPIEDKK